MPPVITDQEIVIMTDVLEALDAYEANSFWTGKTTLTHFVVAGLVCYFVFRTLGG